MSPDSNTCDVLIVGSGLMGASVAAVVRRERPSARILMVDAGDILGPRAGQHLYDLPDGRLRMRYTERTSSRIQGLYVEDSAPSAVGGLGELDPGMYRLSSFGERTDAMPSAALAWNVGGMGVHWTAATPTPWGTEIPSFIDATSWARDLATAQQLLRVNPDPEGASTLRHAVTVALNEIFGPRSAPGRAAQPLPMAINPDDQGGLVRTGPSTVFPAIADDTDPYFELRPGTQARRVLTHRSQSVGLMVRHLPTGRQYRISAETTVLCADVFRTPQLLFASGIRPRALGRYLNEHIFLTGDVDVDLGLIGLQPADLAREGSQGWLYTSFWLPHSDHPQPFNGQLSATATMSEDGRVLDCRAGLALYVPTETQETNRVSFSETQCDALGLPTMTISFGYTDADLQLLKEAREAQAEAGSRLGGSSAIVDARVQPPGTSLHMTGTVRMGPSNDGTSVCDPHGRVWEVPNVYLAGCGVVPTPLVGNSTLSGVVTAVRAGQAVARDLS